MSTRLSREEGVGVVLLVVSALAIIAALWALW